MDEIKITRAAEDWVEIQKLFPAWAALKPTSAWVNGISSRLVGSRLSRLLKGARVEALTLLIDQKSDERIKALRTFAAVNLEQATAAFRLTMIANVSAPILLLTITHQLIDGGLGRLLAEIHENDPIIITGMVSGAAIGALLLLGVAFYALANLNQARDIRHLIDLLAAERGIYFGLEDLEDAGV